MSVPGVGFKVERVADGEAVTARCAAASADDRSPAGLARDHEVGLEAANRDRVGKRRKGRHTGSGYRGGSIVQRQDLGVVHAAFTGHGEQEAAAKVAWGSNENVYVYLQMAISGLLPSDLHL